MRAATLSQPVRYPELYPWLLLAASLDIMMTWFILALGGWEANPIAQVVIERGGLMGMTLYKLLLMTLVIVVCEFVGSRREHAGRALAGFAVIANVFPVVYGASLVAAW